MSELIAHLDFSAVFHLSWLFHLAPPSLGAASSATDLGLWGLLIAVIAGAHKVGTPFLFVSLGECITEKSGRVNLGLEGTLVMGAMTGFAIQPGQDRLPLGVGVCWRRLVSVLCWERSTPRFAICPASITSPSVFR